MLRMKGLAIYCLFLIAVLCCVIPARGLAQAGKSAESEHDEPTLRALLVEVRQLRLAIERSNLGAFRVQIAIERMRLQQGRVDSVARDLENLRLQLSNMKMSRAQTEARLKELEDQMNDETETARKAQLDRQHKEAKRNMDTQAKWEEQTRERERQLSIRLQEEQGKLSEVNNRLDTLERQLEQEQYEDKPRKEKTRP